MYRIILPTLTHTGVKFTSISKFTSFGVACGLFGQPLPILSNPNSLCEYRCSCIACKSGLAVYCLQGRARRLTCSQASLTSSQASLTSSQACVQDAAVVLHGAGAQLRATAAFAAALYLYESGGSFLSRCPTLAQPLPLAQTRSLAVALWCGAVGNSWLLVSRSRTLPHPWPTRTRLTSSGSAGTAGTMTPPASILLPSGTGITRLAAPMIRSLSLSRSLSLRWY
jgi:hypothetical protein